MQGVAWFLPLLDRPVNQRAIKRVNIDAAVGQPAPTAALPARGKEIGERQHGFPAIETDGFGQQQTGDHLGEEHQKVLVADRAVLTKEADQLTMQLGTGCREVLVKCRSPTFPLLPSRPLS